MIAMEENQELVRIIASLYEFTDGGARGRRVLMQQANLGRFILGIDLAGDARTVAGDIIGRLKNFGYLPERRTYHALGALLSYVLTLGDLPADQAHFLASLIVRYALVADPMYIDRLHADYGITETETQPPASAQISPPFTSVRRPDVPTFEVALNDEQGLERIINSQDNFLDIYLLAGAIYSAQGVCRIENPENNVLGTGLLIGPDLLLTNQHVLKNQNYLGEAVARFDYRIDASGVAAVGRVFKLHPNFYFSSNVDVLDYALVRLQDQPLKHMVLGGVNDLSYLDLVLQGKHRGYLVLAEHFIKEHDRVNIIQHPDGKPMKVVMTQNYVVANMADTRVQYIADTMEGSSGSPVFNQNWEVVALHHSGEPYPPEAVHETLKKAWKGRFRVNEGIPIETTS